MKKISFKGNMPKPVQLFATQLTGIFSGQKETEFWEASSISEFEKNASEIGYEIVPTLDSSTGRGFLVGFEVEDSKIVGRDGQSYNQLKMYFIEVTEEQLNYWTKKIKLHRDLQQQDYFDRQKKIDMKRGKKL